jgi:hypothetical protein
MLRAGANRDGEGLVSGDLLWLRETPVVRAIRKHPKQPRGMVYIGELTLIARAGIFILTATCTEVGMTGLRDSVISAECMVSGAISLDLSTKSMVGWFCDPYDPSGNYPCMPNISEQEKFDERFPDHPLSRCRRYLNRMQESLEFDKTFFELPDGIAGLILKMMGR